MVDAALLYEVLMSNSPDKTSLGKLQTRQRTAEVQMSNNPDPWESSKPWNPRGVAVIPLLQITVSHHCPVINQPLLVRNTSKKPHSAVQRQGVILAAIA
ncbi:hypothetical protein J6590_029957 [Homalodisca vitripennis]|nr:hypothetical protein J6590_029957 [Homalodisca vitripennis]